MGYVIVMSLTNFYNSGFSSKKVIFPTAKTSDYSDLSFYFS